jgi:hypothetical protein
MLFIIENGRQLTFFAVDHRKKTCDRKIDMGHVLGVSNPLIQCLVTSEVTR